MLSPNGKQNSGLDAPLNLQPCPQLGGWGCLKGGGRGRGGREGAGSSLSSTLLIRLLTWPWARGSRAQR